MNSLPEYRVLIVEDHSLVCEMLAAMLEQIDCSVAGVAANGEEAVELTRQLRPDVILLDIDLPGIDGIEAARRITVSCPTPIVVVTALDAPGLLERASEVGVGAYLGKPPALLDLERAITIATARFADLMALRRLNAEREEAERATQQHSRELELLYQAGQAFGATLDLDRVLVAVLEQTRQLLGATTCVIGLIDPETGALLCRQAAGFEGFNPCGRRLAPGQGLAGWVVQHGESVLVADAQADPRYYRDSEGRTDPVPRSSLSVPLRTRQGVIGVLQAASVQAGCFSRSDQRLLESLAVSAAAAIENAQLYAAAQQELERRRKAEEELRKSKYDLAKAQRLGHLGNWDWDVAGNSLTWSDEIYRIFGVDADFPLTYAGIEALVHPGDRERNEKAVRALLDTADSGAFELRIVRSDGAVRHIYQSAEVSRDAQGNPRRIFGTMQDVTERKQAEEALQEREARFRELAQENARLLRQARSDAEVKARLLQEVNHRVRNNLAALLGLLHAEQRHVRAGEPVDYRGLLKQLASRIESWAVTQNLLSSSGWASPCLDALAYQVIEAVLKTVPGDKHLTVDVARSEARIPSRAAHSVALLVNELTTNTVKHALGDRQAAQVSVDVRREGDAVCLVYRDDGPGYPEDVLRLERSGLGLELVQALVRHDLQGELVLYNEDGAVAQVCFGALAEETAGREDDIAQRA